MLSVDSKPWLKSWALKWNLWKKITLLLIKYLLDGCCLWSLLEPFSGKTPQKVSGPQKKIKVTLWAKKTCYDFLISQDLLVLEKKHWFFKVNFMGNIITMKITSFWISKYQALLVGNNQSYSHVKIRGCRLLLYFCYYLKICDCFLSSFFWSIYKNVIFSDLMNDFQIYVCFHSY